MRAEDPLDLQPVFKEWNAIRLRYSAGCRRHATHVISQPGYCSRLDGFSLFSWGWRCLPAVAVRAAMTAQLSFPDHSMAEGSSTEGRHARSSHYSKQPSYLLCPKRRKDWSPAGGRRDRQDGMHRRFTIRRHRLRQQTARSSAETSANPDKLSRGLRVAHENRPLRSKRRRAFRGFFRTERIRVTQNTTALTGVFTARIKS